MKMMGGRADYNDYNDYNDGEQEEEEDEEAMSQKKSNLLPVWGNEKTMNLNTLVLTNIQSSQYFKVKLYALKTYHEVLDEIYYQVTHLEPWEKGSRKTAGQTGMCGGVRGVGAGGIVSTAYCILYKLFTLRLTRKQLSGCINHTDSPYIRGLGFMYIRYTQPPADLWTMLEPYLDDEEEIDVRAGGGQSITIGAMCRHLLTKLDWHSTLFPRIPVPIQKDIEKKIQARDGQANESAMRERLQQQQGPARAWKDGGGVGGGRSHGNSPIASSNGRALSRDRHDSKDRPRGSRDPVSKDRSRHPSRDRERPSRDQLSRDREPRSKDWERRSGDKDRLSRDCDRRSRDKDRLSRDRRSKDKDYLSRDRRDRDRHSKVRGRGSRDRSPKDRERHRDRRDRDHHKRDRERRDVEPSRRKSRDRHTSRDRDSRDKHKRDRKDRDGRRHHRSRSGTPQDFSADLQREKERIKSRPRSRSRSRDRDRKHR